MKNINLEPLSDHQLNQGSGGVAPLVVMAVYTFVMPILALGTAVGVDEAVEARQ